jgi:hypothetical protein
MMGTVRRVAVQRHAQTQSVKLSRFCIHGVVDFKNFFQVRDQLSRDMLRAADAGRGHVELAGIGLSSAVHALAKLIVSP